jgi:choline dehydrogenase
VRGTGGPLTVAPAAEHDPLAEAFVAAAVEVGFPRANDITSGVETGFGWTDLNIVDGMRQSAADAYLRPPTSSATISTSSQMPRHSVFD